MDFMQEVAKKKLNAPEGWMVFRYTRIGDTDDFVVKGGIPRILKSGKNKGKRRWGGETNEAVVTRAELDAEMRLYEKNTGNCGFCIGKGQVFSGWSRDKGTTYHACLQCSGSGKCSKAP